MTRKLSILYVGGGTGGHIFPLYALYQWLCQSGVSGADSLFVGLRGRIDSAIYAELSVPHVLENLPQPAGVAARLSYLLRAMIAWLRWLPRIRQYDCVVTSGGYGSLPAVLAARVRGVPTIGYEPNAVTGRTMRFIGPAALAQAARPFVNDAAPLIRTEVYPPLGHPTASDTLLICGGSQGSLSLDKLMLAAMQDGLPPGIKNVIWLTGSAGYDEVKAAVGADARFEVAAYSANMAALYQRTRLAVARAGASSIFELAAWGIPTVYVPLPWSADDHQLANARAAAARGWGLVVEERAGVLALVSALRAAAGTVIAPAIRPSAAAAHKYWTQRVLAAVGVPVCA